MLESVRGDFIAGAAEKTRAMVRLRDTADHRLAVAGFRLECAALGRGREIWRLIPDDGGDSLSETVAVPAPTFADGLPSGQLAHRLEEICKGRAVHPKAEVTLAETVVPLRDEEGKIRCRLVLSTASAPDAQPVAELGVRALKGYESDARRVRDRMTQHLGWPPSTLPAVTAVYRMLRPKALPKRPAVRADDPAGPVMRELLWELLDVIEDRLPGVIADTDPAYLHQMRVAVRRTRSALSQLAHAIALEGQAEAVEGFRWLGQVTSPLRDLDVQLIDLAARKRELGDDAHALGALETLLTDRKVAAHRGLVLDLTGARFELMIRRWRESLSPSSANWTATEPLRTPFTQVVATRGKKLLRRVIRDGRRIRPDSPAETLHDLRKRMKKLRYVTEFLAEVMPRDRMRPVIKALKGLQDVLGRVQDREIQVIALRAQGHDLASARKVDADALMAIGAWSEDLDRDRRDARAEFADAFARFTARETQALFHGIFADAVEAKPDTAWESTPAQPAPGTATPAGAIRRLGDTE
jgi:CHAD domain-containing protein